MGFFRHIVHRPQWVTGARDTPRHRHLEAYATVVLDGAYEQFAYAGCLRVGPGQVLVQPTLDCHADRMLSGRARLLRLPWPRDEGLGGVFRPCGLDLVVRRVTAGQATTVRFTVTDDCGEWQTFVGGGTAAGF